MAHFLVSDDQYRDLIYQDDRSHRFGPSKSMRRSPGDYRFGRAHGKPARGSLGRVNGYFKRVIEAIANSKLRRMERELELRGVWPYDNG
jgi:hypothetical protein